jgi:hypothetical protein
LRRTGRHPLVAGALLAAVVLALSVPLVAAADEVSVSARVDRTTTTVIQPVTLTITIEGTMRQVPEPTLPNLADAFNMQTAGTSSNFSFVNGKMSTSKSWNFVLYPRAAGTFTIGPAEVEFDNVVYRTEPIEIEVLEGDAPPAEPESLEERPSSGVRADDRGIFITTSVDKERAYVDEQITLSFKFYRRVNLSGQPRYTPPDLTGFWVEEFPSQEEYYETAGTYRYHVVEIKTALFGAAAGEATIGPAIIRYEERGRPFTFFPTRGTEHTLRTDPITVEILPLPAKGRPADFGGAVGSYRLRASLDPESADALEPVTLAIRLSGNGNIRTVPAPATPDLAEFKVYESGSSTNVSTDNGVVGGSRTFEFVLVPQTAGTKTIPDLSMSYFDPASRTYKQTGPGELTLEVAPAAAAEEVPSLPARTRISRVGWDIRYIHEPTETLRPAGAPVHTRPWFLGLQLLPLAALVTAWTGKRRRDRYATDRGLARYARASGKARNEFREARSYLSKGDRTGACSAIARALTGFVGDRLNVETQGMTQAELESALRKAGADGELIDRVRRLLNECDLGRFAGGSDAVDAERLLSDAQTCLRGLEKLPGRRRR